jgi:hypothetical protein
MACWVAATMVHAAATAVPCTSSGESVGSACPPHAVSRMANAANIGTTFFIIFSLHLYCYNEVIIVFITQ